MGWLLGLVTRNPLVLLWLTLGAFAAGALSGGGAAWKVQDWRLDAVQTKYDAFVANTKLLGEQAEMEKKRVEDSHTKATKEVKDAIPKQIAAARSSAVRNYLARMPAHPSSGSVSCPANSPGRADGPRKEPVAPGWSGTTNPAFIEDCAQDAATIGLWQTWARGIGFPVK